MIDNHHQSQRSTCNGVCTRCMCAVERPNPHVEGCTAAEVGTVTTEAGSLLSIQCRRADAVNGHVHCSRSLARVYLVFHWT